MTGPFRQKTKYLEDSVPRKGKSNGDHVVRAGMIETTCLATPTLNGKLIFFYEWCKHCGLCTTICPTGALAESPEHLPFMANPDKCTLCSLCWRICPDFAVLKNPNFTKEEEDAPANNG